VIYSNDSDKTKSIKRQQQNGATIRVNLLSVFLPKRGFSTASTSEFTGDARLYRAASSD